MGQKPQFLFLFDSSWRFWNLPVPEELETKVRIRAVVSELSEADEIEKELRDFNARTADMLLMSIPGHSSLMKSLSIFNHPSRALSAELSREHSSTSVRWDLVPVISLIADFCQAAAIKCQYPGELLTKLENWGFEIKPNNEDPEGSDRPLLNVNFSSPFLGEVSQSSLSISVNWVNWSEQLLRDLRQSPQKSASNAPWREISLARGNLNIDLSLSQNDPLYTRQKELREALQKLRLKHLN